MKSVKIILIKIVLLKTILIKIALMIVTLDEISSKLVINYHRRKFAKEDAHGTD